MLCGTIQRCQFGACQLVLVKACLVDIRNLDGGTFLQEISCAGGVAIGQPQHTDIIVCLA